MAHCIVCRLPHERRELIEKMLVDKVPYQNIEDSLREYGTAISKTSLGRHKKNHMDLPPEPAKPTTAELCAKIADTEDPQGTPVDCTNIDKYREMAQQTDLLEVAVRERRTSQLMLEKIMQNQLTIVEDMQGKFMKGNGEYPRDPITGLKSLMDMIQKLPAYSEREQKLNHREHDVKARQHESAKKVVDEIKAFRTKHGGKYRFGIYFENSHESPVLPHVEKNGYPIMVPHEENPILSLVYGLIELSPLEKLEWYLVEKGYRSYDKATTNQYREIIEPAIAKHPNNFMMQTATTTYQLNQIEPDEPDEDEDE